MCAPKRPDDRHHRADQVPSFRATGITAYLANGGALGPRLVSGRGIIIRQLSDLAPKLLDRLGYSG
jgi:hypothetical protein